MSLTADQTYFQVRWEQEAINRGIARYREVSSALDPTTLSPGKALLRAVVPPLVEAIKVAQEEALAAQGVRTREPLWCLPILMLPPEALAVITSAILLRAASEGATTSRARAIAKACRDQIEFSRWERKMLDDRVTGTWDALSTYRTRYPNANNRSWRGWRKRVEDLETVDWSPSLETQLGAHLIHLAVTAAPEWFIQKTQRQGIKTSLVVALSPEAEEVMLDLEQRAEIARPYRLPMIVPPLAWRYE